MTYKYYDPTVIDNRCEGYEEYIKVVISQICKGLKGSHWMPELKPAIPGEFVRDCFLVAGNQPAARSLTLPWADETIYNYKDRIEKADPWQGTWSVLDTDEEGFEYKDQDFLVWSWSQDGTELPPKEKILQDGNVTGSFLVKASGDYPTVWLSHDPSVPGGVYPMEICGSKMRHLELLKGRVVWVIRFRPEDHKDSVIEIYGEQEEEEN